MHFFLYFIVPMEIFPWEIRIAFPEENQLRANQLELISYNLVYETNLCDHTTGYEAYSFTTVGHRIFNVCTHLGACRTHEGGSDTKKSAQELSRRDRKTVSHPAPPGDRTQGLRI